MEGITALIELLDSGDGKTQCISPREFTNAIREGMKTEPEKFPHLVKALESRIQRAYPEWSSEEAKQRALANIAGYACMADHDYETEMMIRAATDGPKRVEEWYDRPQEYGEAMTALADYVGVKGPALREFILDFKR